MVENGDIVQMVYSDLELSPRAARNWYLFRAPLNHGNDNKVKSLSRPPSYRAIGRTSNLRLLLVISRQG